MKYAQQETRRAAERYHSLMLSYVFWHWPVPGIPVHEYVARLEAFHRELGAQRPAGLRGSQAWRVDGAPWALETPAFEDWYLLDAAASLDTLAEVSVSGTTRGAHDAAAREAGGGAAGLYKPVRSVEGVPGGSLAVWFDKPPGLSYAALFEHLEEIDATIPTRLWQRFLVLGPTPEFCLLGEDVPALPGTWHTSVVRRHSVL